MEALGGGVEEDASNQVFIRCHADTTGGRLALEVFIIGIEDRAVFVMRGQAWWDYLSGTFGSSVSGCPVLMLDEGSGVLLDLAGY